MRLIDKLKSQMFTSLAAAVVLAVVFMVLNIGLPLTAPAFQPHKWYNVFVLSLLGIVGGMMGWLVGVLLSPIGNQKEGSQRILGAVSLFWSGVIVGHINDLTSFLTNRSLTNLPSGQKIRILFMFGLFLFAFVLTFNTRYDPSLLDLPEQRTPHSDSTND
jgi:hypothetical protein